MTKQQPKIKLAAIAKNEAAYIPEWVFHHFYFGFDSIEIWVNDTGDNSLKLLETLKESCGERLEYCIADSLLQECVEKKLHFQFEAYKKIFNSARKHRFDYILFLDLDEFWTPADFSSDIHSFIRGFEKIKPSSISFQWFVDIPDIDKPIFCRPFEQQNLLQKDRHVKSLLDLSCSPKQIRMHNTVFEKGDYFLANKDVFLETDQKEQHNKSLVAKAYFEKNKLSLEPFFITHKIYRSQFEYVSSLSRARTHTIESNTKVLKDNRIGFIPMRDSVESESVVFQISKDRLNKYNTKYNEFMTKSIINELLDGQNFLRKRFENLVTNLKDDNGFLFKKYQYLFNGIQLDVIKELRKEMTIKQPEFTIYYNIDSFEIDDDCSLLVRGWAFSDNNYLNKNDISIYVGDNKIPFLLKQEQRADVVDKMNNSPLECGFCLKVDEFRKYLNNKEKITLKLKNIFIQFDNPYKKKQQQFVNQAVKYRNEGNLEGLRQGVIEQPFLLDQYGHPAFKKELMRFLLSQKRWDEAKLLIPKSNEQEDNDWHEILFARAYSTINDIDNAKKWWNLVAKRNPNHNEAKEFFLRLNEKKGISNVASTVRTWTINDISSTPSMEQEGKELLTQYLMKSKVFLEYGAGGSTVLAASLGINTIYSVESDKRFLEAVQAKVASLGSSVKLEKCFINIGKTKELGYPVDNSCISQWVNYPSLPWKKIIETKQFPEVILIDGRFRVACFLTSLLMARKGTIILFDDYFDRPHYHEIEKHLKPSKAAGRMGGFVVPSEISVPNVLSSLLMFLNNPA